MASAEFAACHVKVIDTSDATQYKIKIVSLLLAVLY